ncbi:MAG: M15 family metallopeptidase [Oscillospiraceae bacterium]|nr:M15 family metallopeptidase [Oscillospiraceae bacterium]
MKKNKKRNKVLWLFEMAALCLALYLVVNARTDRTKPVVFEGAQGGLTSADSFTYLDPSATPTPDPNAVKWPKLTVEDLKEKRQYTIVNDDHLLSSAFKPDDTGKISGTNQLFDAEILPYLEAMLQDMRDHGYSPYIAGAYRSYSYQEKLFNGKASQIAMGMNPPVSDYMDERYQIAVAEARTIVMFPGSSEHQLGYAVDILDRQRTRLVYENMNKEFFAYLDSICAQYGFIKRYPTNKLLLTGWDEPYHYRYVGVEAATFIMEHGICYEEFYAHYDPEFTFGAYVKKS